jgi:plastocyanin
LINRRTALAGLAGVAAISLTSEAHAKTIHEVSIHKFKFQPKSLTVKPGDVIRWTNFDLAPHTATAAEGDWDTEALSKGESVEIGVKADMTPDYFCAFHPHMKGSVSVE